MSRRLLTAGLTLGAVLAGFASAKPPDLPLPQNDALAPAVPVEENKQAPSDLFPPAAAPVTKAPVFFFSVRPSVRRTMASCLLFGANPLLALAPTAEYVDFDEDDSTGAGFLSLFSKSSGGSVNTDGAYVGTEARNETPPNGNIKYISLDMAISLASHEATESPEPLSSCQAAGQDEPPSVCPWMRQQQCAPVRPALLSADIDLSHDVLDNLEMLRQAHELLQDARELGRDGRMGEAMDCLQLAHGLCPNVWLDEKVQEASAEVFAASDSVSLQPCLPPVDPQVSTALDGLYPETAPPVQLVAAEEEDPSVEVVKGTAKPLVKADGLDEVGRAKDGGSPMSCMDVLKEFAALVPPDHGELLIGVDGRLRVFTQIHRGGAIWHMLYDNGTLSVWASPDGGADAEAPDENPPDDASAD